MGDVHGGGAMSDCNLCRGGETPRIVEQVRADMCICVACCCDVTLAVARIRGAEECANAALQLSWRKRKYTKRACA